MPAFGGMTGSPRASAGALQSLSLQRVRAPGVERVDFRTVGAGSVALDVEAGLDLQIGEVAVADWKAIENLLVERDRGGGIKRHQPIHFVDQSPHHDAPLALALLQEIVEPPGADHVAWLAVDYAALGDRHLGHGDGALALNVDRRAAEQVDDAHAIGVALLARRDEFIDRALEPGSVHPAILMPDGAEALPHQAVAVHGPVLDQLANRKLVCGVAAWWHGIPRLVSLGTLH